MAKYRVLAVSYINNKLVQVGEVVEYKGKVGSNLKLIKSEPDPADDDKPAGDPDPVV